MVHQVGVQRVVPGHQHRESLLAGASGPARLLPQRRPGARISADHDRVQPDQVDPQLQGVRRGQTEQLAVQQRPLQLATLLAQVAGPVRGHPVAEPRHRLVEAAPGAGRHHLGAPAGADEGQRAYPGGDGVGEQVGGLPQRRAANLGQLDPGSRPAADGSGGSSGLPEGEGDPGARRGVLGDGCHREAGQPAAAAAGSPDVADASTNVGPSARPYRAHCRRSRRSTWATCEPNTPR